MLSLYVCDAKEKKIKKTNKCPYRNCVLQKTVTRLTNLEFNNDEVLTVD